MVLQAPPPVPSGHGLPIGSPGRTSHPREIRRARPDRRGLLRPPAHGHRVHPADRVPAPGRGRGPSRLHRPALPERQPRKRHRPPGRCRMPLRPGRGTPHVPHPHGLLRARAGPHGPRGPPRQDPEPVHQRRDRDRGTGFGPLSARRIRSLPAGRVRPQVQPLPDARALPMAVGRHGGVAALGQGPGIRPAGVQLLRPGGPARHARRPASGGPRQGAPLPRHRAYGNGQERAAQLPGAAGHGRPPAASLYRRRGGFLPPPRRLAEEQGTVRQPCPPGYRRRAAAPLLELDENARAGCGPEGGCRRRLPSSGDVRRLHRLPGRDGGGGQDDHHRPGREGGGALFPP